MLHVLQNKYWQAGILPETGASVAFGRMRYAGTWVDVLRPTAPENYTSVSKCSSFLMLPWANRIRDGVLRFQDQAYQLEVAVVDNTARHGDVRGRAWQVRNSSETGISLSLDSSDFTDFNFPFALRAEMTYALHDADFVWQVALHNTDTRAFPAGFGHHPYFVIPSGQAPQLQVPCSKHFELVGAMASAGAVDLPAELDFRQPRPIQAHMGLEHLLTGRSSDDPVRLHYPDWRTTIRLEADPIFQHILLFSAPDGTLAIEPQTNANDGFNLYQAGIEGSGIFVLEPGQTIHGTIRFTLEYGVY